MTPAGSHGKVQGFQSFMRGGGMFMGMVVAGVLFYRWEPLPFIMCSVLIMVFTYLTVVKIREPEPERSHLPPRQGIWGEVKRVILSVREDKGHPAFHGGELSLGVDVGGAPSVHHAVLHLHTGLHRAGGRLAAWAGRSDVYGGGHSERLLGRQVRPDALMRVGLWVYLGGCILGTFMGDIKWAFIFLPLFGLGGSIVLTLPYAILIRLMPKEHIGQFTGMFSMMRGLANIIAPVVAGGAIDIAARSSIRVPRGPGVRGHLAGLSAHDRDLVVLLPWW